MTGPSVHRLEDLVLHPELLAPPAARLPRLAWAGRVSLVAWPEKAGKSTLLGQAVAASVTGEPFLGELVTAKRALILGLDEPLGDTVRRYATFGAERGILLMTERPDAATLHEIMHEEAVDLLVVDSLSEFARGIIQDYNSAAEWTPLLGELRRTAQATNAAIVLVHHVTKGPNGRYRDSSAIGAGVDVILEGTVDEADPTVRKVRARGRFTMSDFILRYTAGRYHLDGGELPLEMRVYRAIEADPGVSLSALRERVGGRSSAIDGALADLFHKRAIEDRGDRGKRRFYTSTARTAKTTGTTSGQPRDNLGPSHASACGTTPDNPGTGSGTTQVVPPPIRGGLGQPPEAEFLEGVA